MFFDFDESQQSIRHVSDERAQQTITEIRIQSKR